MISIKRFPYRQVMTETYQLALSRIAAILPDLTDLTFIDETALTEWQQQWLPAMPPGHPWSDWDWGAEMQRWAGQRHRLDLAIWSREHLCGLAIGRSSPRKQNFSFRVLQGSPIDQHPLKGQILPILIEIGTMYGTALDCRQLRFLQPLPGMIPVYERMGFRLARTSGGVHYCVRSL